MMRGKKNKKVMFTMGNIKKFTTYKIHNKAVTAVGQHGLHHSATAMTGERCSGIGTSGRI